MSSIYVSIPSLFDRELPITVRNCLHHSSKKVDINIGVSFSSYTHNVDIDDLKNELGVGDNVRFKYVESNNSVGVGASRRHAYSMYDGEDYILQIDAHSHFKKDWDLILIDTLNKVEKRHGKSVLTGYPAPYMYENGEKKLVSFSWLPTISEISSGRMSDERRDEGRPLVWGILPHWKSRTVTLRDPEYIVIPKISAGFLFGGKEFAESYENTIPYNYLFFEEEIVATLETISMGFELICPIYDIPVAHLYGSDINDAEFDRESFPVELLYSNYELIASNYYNYCKNNLNKVELFKDRTGIDILSIAESHLMNEGMI